MPHVYLWRVGAGWGVTVPNPHLPVLGMRACEAPCTDAGALCVGSATLGSDCHGCGCWPPAAYLLLLHLQEVLLQEEEEQEGEGQRHEECHEHEGHERGPGRLLGRGWGELGGALPSFPGAER